MIRPGRLRSSASGEISPLRSVDAGGGNSDGGSARPAMVVAVLGPVAAAGAGSGRVASPAACSPESVSKTTSSEPTGTMSPGAALRASTRPLTGAGTSTAALSVITSAMIWSSSTRSPTLTCQATTSASTVPSPRSGILNT
jgi:hypothetical protein